jgi:DNA-binding MarR family transcriptional regulator
MAAVSRRLVDYVMDLKTRCRFDEEIGAECGLAPREVSCLGVLSPGEKVTAGELARRMALSPSRASRLLTSLREKGMLEENLHQSDRRAVSIQLTPTGEELLKRIDRKKDECEKRLTAALDQAQQRAVRRGLSALRVAMEGGAYGKSRGS